MKRHVFSYSLRAMYVIAKAFQALELGQPLPDQHGLKSHASSFEGFQRSPKPVSINRIAKVADNHQEGSNVGSSKC